MSRSAWVGIAMAAVCAQAVEMFLGFGLWFAPGWANGWPGGLPFHAVWSAGMAGVVFLLLMTTAVAVGAVVVAVSDRPEANRRPYLIWLALAAVVGLAAGWWTYEYCHAATLQMFPNGYNPQLTPAPPAVGN